MFSYLNPFPHLPRYSGPHKVGTTTFEIPISEIPSSSAVPDQKITTIKFRLFYPTTPNAQSKTSVYWLPEPQKQWNAAYASFMGAADSGWSTLVAHRALSIWNNAKIPALADTALNAPPESVYPVCIFSHGLGGNFNTYSTLVGSLASCGVVCVVPEHRDGSAPISFIKNAETKTDTSVPYQKLSHSPTPEVLNVRNAQLRVRLWELELLYSVIIAMNSGKTFTNYATRPNADIKEKDRARNLQTMLTAQLNLQPGQVTWLGHSFGAATMTQLVKSVFYRQHLPAPPIELSNDQDFVDWTPLYTCNSNSDLVRQITPSSPVVLLDTWTMPLRGESTQWLWERPMPCYAQNQPNSSTNVPSTVAIMSAEFHKWTDLLNRTRALLSSSPFEASAAFERRKQEKEQATTTKETLTDPKLAVPGVSKQTANSPASPDQSRTPSPVPAIPSSDPNTDSESTTSSTTSLTPSIHEPSHPSTTTPKSDSNSNEPHLYLVPNSAHLSQSDFGVLFPNLTKYAMKAIEPEKTIQLNVRAILAVMRGQDLPVENLFRDGKEDHILHDLKDGEKIDRWARIPLID